MEKIRIGVIGNGIIGESHISGYKGIGGCEVTAICDINEDRLNYIGDKYGIKARYTHIGKMIAEADLDSVDVCLHNNMHAPVSIYAMEQGKHVYCEKPMAGTYADALAMYDAMLNTGKKLHIQLGFLYSDETRAAKRLIENGRLGNIYHMRSYGFRRRGRPFVDGYATKEFVNTETSGGGALFDMGVYHISQLLYLMDTPELERICGHTYAELPMDEGRRAESGYNVEELGCGYASFKGGLTMDILESWAIYAAPFPGSMIAGSKGGLTLTPFKYHTAIDDIQADMTFDLGHFNYLNHTVYAENAVYDNSQKLWIAALQGQAELYPTAKIALDTQLIQEGIYMSNALGREVSACEIKEMTKSKALEIPNLKY
ncbi:MAG: Gfo/Idh/MocA family oxidoreductase [Eubacteriales bacterium]|jgi:predicted dehydrogenase|nr:Gfo/Idh/MocA family oxidoreductase [Eubacteriales bacterium]